MQKQTFCVVKTAFYVELHHFSFCLIYNKNSKKNMNPAKIAEEIILNLLKSVLTEKYRGGVKRIWYKILFLEKRCFLKIN